MYDSATDAQVWQTPLKTYFCPSRRPPTRQGDRYLNDYASATPGDTGNINSEFWGGDIWNVPPNATFNGIIVRTGGSRKTTFGNILDGAANTFAIGEKMVQPSLYDAGDWHDDRGWTDGWDPDTIRFTAFRPFRDVNAVRGNAPDGNQFGHHFGSQHPAGFNAVFGDGAVRVLAYEIDRVVFNRLGDRRDGETLPAF